MWVDYLGFYPFGTIGLILVLIYYSFYWVCLNYGFIPNKSCKPVKVILLSLKILFIDLYNFILSN